jgi:hypothetical protein
MPRTSWAPSEVGEVEDDAAVSIPDLESLLGMLLLVVAVRQSPSS